MSAISAQISLYPLRQSNTAPVIQDAVTVFEQQGLDPRVGAMSTVVWGEMDCVFRAVRAAFERAESYGQVVMVVTFSNACPGPASGCGGADE